MNSARFEWKVGLFVLIGLALLGTLFIEFSKGASLFTKTYELRLVTSNAGAIQPKSGVLMAGLPVGSVDHAEFNPDNRSVMIFLRIYSKFPIQTNAVFSIDQSGFLGDQYISVTPGPRTKVYFQNGAIVPCQPPFNILDATRSAMGLMQGVDSLVAAMDQALRRLDRVVLNETNLNALTNAFASLKPLSERVRSVVSNVDLLIQTNRPRVDQTVSNLAVLSSKLDRLATTAQSTLDTNAPEIHTTLTNLAAASGRANEVLTRLQAGQGMAGGLLVDPQLRRELAASMSNLTVLSSNLTRFGLLYKPKPVKHRENSNSKLLVDPRSME